MVLAELRLERFWLCRMDLERFESMWSVLMKSKRYATTARTEPEGEK